MKNYKIQLQFIILLIILTPTKSYLQQMEIEHEANSNSPHFQLMQTTNNESSRMFFKNTFNPSSKWEINANNGLLSRNHQFGVSFNDDYRFLYNETNKEFKVRNNLTLAPGPTEFASILTFLLNENGPSNNLGGGIIWKNGLSNVASIVGSSTNFGSQFNSLQMAVGEDPDLEFFITEDVVDITHSGSEIMDDNLLTIKGNSAASATQIKVIESGPVDFARIGFQNSSSTDFFNIAAKPGDADDPRLQIAFNGDPILIVDGDEERIGINKVDPEYTFVVNHDTGQPNNINHNGLGLRNDDNGNQWIFYSFVSGDKLGLFFKDEENGGAITHIGNFLQNGTYMPQSDASLKSNVGDLSDQLVKLLLLKPKSYQLNSIPGQTQFGLLAQDVQQVIPEVVHELESSQEGGSDYLGVGYTELIPIIIASIQEQQEIIKDLQVEIELLKE